MINSRSDCTTKFAYSLFYVQHYSKSFSPGFDTVAPVVVLILPDGQAPDTVLPGVTWVEYTGA